MIILGLDPPVAALAAVVRRTWSDETECCRRISTVEGSNTPEHYTTMRRKGVTRTEDGEETIDRILRIQEDMPQ